MADRTAEAGVVARIRAVAAELGHRAVVEVVRVAEAAHAQAAARRVRVADPAARRVRAVVPADRQEIELVPRLAIAVARALKVE